MDALVANFFGDDLPDRFPDRFPDKPEKKDRERDFRNYRKYEFVHGGRWQKGEGTAPTDEQVALYRSMSKTSNLSQEAYNKDNITVLLEKLKKFNEDKDNKKQGGPRGRPKGRKNQPTNNNNEEEQVDGKAKETTKVTRRPELTKVVANDEDLAEGVKEAEVEGELRQQEIEERESENRQLMASVARAERMLLNIKRRLKEDEARGKKEEKEKEEKDEEEKRRIEDEARRKEEKRKAEEEKKKREREVEIDAELQEALKQLQKQEEHKVVANEGKQQEQEDNHWLSDAEISKILSREINKIKAKDDGNHNHFQVLETAHVAVNLKDLGWLRKGIQNRERVGIVLNTNRNHWVSFVVDFKIYKWWYFDPFGGEPQKDEKGPNGIIIRGAKYWIESFTGVVSKKHCGGRLFESWVNKKRVQQDTYNCGIYAILFVLNAATNLDPSELDDEVFCLEYCQKMRAEWFGSKGSKVAEEEKQEAEEEETREGNRTTGQVLRARRKVGTPLPPAGISTTTPSTTRHTDDAQGGDDGSDPKDNKRKKEGSQTKETTSKKRKKEENVARSPYHLRKKL